MNDLELKRKRIETWAKVIGLGIAGFLFAPIAYATITGLISLIVVGAVALLLVNIGVPFFAASVANWRLKALKAAAAANPIETFENCFRLKQEALFKQRDVVKKIAAISSQVKSYIQQFEEQFNKPCPRREQYEKLNQLVALNMQKYERASVKLAEFGKLIEEKRADWEIVKAMAEANKLALVGEDFNSRLMQDTAFTTVQQGLDMAFAELDASIMDENIQRVLNGQEIQVTVAPLQAEQNAPKQLSDVAKKEILFPNHYEPEPIKIKADKRSKF